MHFLLKAIQFLVMVLRVYLEVLLIVLFYAEEFLITLLYWLRDYLQKLYKALIKNNPCGKLFSSLESPTTFDEIFKVNSVPFFIPDFHLLSCELDNFTFKMLY